MTRLNEVSPPGWGHTKAEKEKTKPNKPKSKIGGTAHAMKLAQKRGDIPKNMNIFALMWSMKNKGDKPHYKPGVKGKLKGKYKGPEGQNEMIDPKKIRNYKNVPNSVVAKADKEAEKVKDKEQKGTLEFPQMPTEESTWSKNFKKQSALRRGQNKRRQQAQQHSPGQRVPPKKEDMSLAPKGKGKKAAKALYQGEERSAADKALLDKAKRRHAQDKRERATLDLPAPKSEDIDMPSLVQQAINELTPDQKKKREASRERTHSGHKSYRQAHDADRGQKKPDRNVRKYWEKPSSMRAGPKGKLPEEVEIDELTADQKKKREASRSHSTLGKGRRLHGGRSAAHPKGAMVSGKTHTYDKPAGAAKKPGRQKIVAKPVEELETEANLSIPPKGSGKPVRKYGSSKGGNLSITPAGKKALKKGDHKLSITPKGREAIKDDYVSHFGDKLRQAIEEAKKVNAIDTINKIVKTKTMGKLHGQKVDLFTASAIQQVYNALNKKNQEKMVSVMSKDVHGLLKMADFSMRQMKR